MKRTFESSLYDENEEGVSSRYNALCEEKRWNHIWEANRVKITMTRWHACSKQYVTADRYARRTFVGRPEHGIVGAGVLVAMVMTLVRTK